MTDAPRSPKSRLRPVYTVDADPIARSETVIYQLEDTGHPVLRLRPSVRVVQEDGRRSYLYRVDAFSRLRGGKVGQAEKLAPPGSPAEFAADARDFQGVAFRETIDELCRPLIRRYGRPEKPEAIQR